VRSIETPIFTRLLRPLLPDGEYRALQLALVLRPDQGSVIPGTGGLRKIRWSASRRGKRGGARIISYWDPRSETFYMLYAFAKNQRADLTADQRRVLQRLVREEFS
jgi:hypothetical protein